jgi:type III pantothenate kinase
MFLAVDMGNSQTSVGVFENGSLLHHWRFETKIARTSDEYASLLFPLLDRKKLSSVHWEAVVLCSVVPPADQAFEDFSTSMLAAPVYKVTHEMKLGFKMAVTFPSEVGADRLANAAYAVKMFTRAE